MPQPFLRYAELQMDLGKQAKDTWSIVGFAAKVHGGAGGPPGALELRSSDSSNLSPEGRIFLEQAHFLHKTCIGKKHTKAHIHTHTQGTCGWRLSSLGQSYQAVGPRLAVLRRGVQVRAVPELAPEVITSAQLLSLAGFIALWPKDPEDVRRTLSDHCPA